jgi:hypothetical protein
MGSTPTNSTHPIIRAAVARAKSRRAHTAGARAAGRKDRACGRWCEAILRETFHRRKASSSWRRVTPHIAGAPRRGHHAAGATLADVAERVPIANARRRPVRLINRKNACKPLKTSVNQPRRHLRCDALVPSMLRPPVPPANRQSKSLTQQRRQLGEVHRHAPRLVARQSIWSPSDGTQQYVGNRGRSGSARLALERRW